MSPFTRGAARRTGWPAAAALLLSLALLPPAVQAQEPAPVPAGAPTRADTLARAAYDSAQLDSIRRRLDSIAAASRRPASLPVPTIRGYVVIPGLSISPETGVGFALAGIKSGRASGVARGTRPSTRAISGLVTTRGQLDLQWQGDLWASGNRRRTEYELRFLRFPNRFFGIGAAIEDSAERYTPQTLSARVSRTWQLRRGLFVGGRAAFETVDVTRIEAGRRLDTLATIPRREGWRSSSLILLSSLDTRDLLFFPSRGGLLSVDLGHSFEALGATQDFTRVTVDLRRYLGLGRAGVVAVQAFGEATGGTVPFDRLPQLGGSRVLRGYLAGRFRDRNLASAQIEYRSPSWRRAGFVLFATGGSVAPSLDALADAPRRTTWGAGFRYALNADRLNLRIDHGRGRGSHGTYITVGEAF